ncbi:MAG: type II toxin-antitoxin system Phd/YefM family antitoxin [Balneolaceae bacterium]
MKKVQVNDVSEHLAIYLSEAERGEEIIITKHSHPIARLIPVKKRIPEIPDLSDHRKSIKVKGKPLSQTVIETRKKERFLVSELLT